MPILSFDLQLSCITPKYGFILAPEDISSDQMLICSLIIQYHWHVSMTGKNNCMRCVTSGRRLLVRSDTCKHPAACPRWMSGFLQERWSSDRTNLQCVFLSTSISHLWSILCSLKLEFYLWVLSDKGTVVMSYLSPSVAKLSTYLIDLLNYNSSRASQMFFTWISLYGKYFILLLH